MLITLNQLQRIAIQNGYTIVPKEFLINYLEHYRGKYLKVGIIHYNYEEEISIKTFNAEAWTDSMNLNDEVVLRKDIAKWVNSFSKYQICLIKQ